MEHPFPSRRAHLLQAERALELVHSVRAISRASQADRVLIRQRCESKIQNEALRATVCQHASRLGLMCDDLIDLLPSETRAPVQLSEAWVLFLSTRDARPPPALASFLAQAEKDVLSQRDQARRLEEDAGSSSYSDYSDSDTESSDDSEASDARKKRGRAATPRASRARATPTARSEAESSSSYSETGTDSATSTPST